MAYFGRMHPVFDKITKRNALYAAIIRVGVEYCNLCSCMGSSNKCRYFEDFVSKIFSIQILVVFGLQREFSLRVGRAPTFTVALGPERSLNGPVHQ